MTEVSQTAPRPLHLQTVDSLLAELISGGSVSIDEGARVFALDSADARAVLNWYRQNQAKWTGNVQTADLEALSRASASAPPTLAVPIAITPQPGRRLYLSSITAHRFAGIHCYGTVEDAPPDFKFGPTAKITVLEGWNGAGKTSILNAVIWCLTGRILRPQREPESGELEFSGLFSRSKEVPPAPTMHALTPITPLPNPEHYVPPADKPVPADSWVELAFVDQNNVPLPPVRRTQSRTAKGKLVETLDGIETLNVDPVSMQIGTLLPALIPFIQVGAASDLGEAVARITGLAPLSDLARHASRSKDRIEKDLQKGCAQEVSRIDDRFLQIRKDLQEAINEYPGMAPKEELPQPSSSPDLEAFLTRLETHFEQLRARALSEAATILGPSFDASDKQARRNLEDSVGAAIGQLKDFSQLSSVKRMRELSSIEPLQWSEVRGLIEKLSQEAHILAELATTPDLARRKQLYSAVAEWMAEGGRHDFENCNVCNRSLDGIRDPITGRPVSDHLREIGPSERQLLSLTQAKWASIWLGRLATTLPPPLRIEIERDLPAHPRELIRSALVDELFSSESFSGTLATLKSGMAILCDANLPKAAPFSEPEPPSIPIGSTNEGQALLAKVARLLRAESFARWRHENEANVRTLTNQILRGTAEEATPMREDTPIATKLDALQSIVRGTTPIKNAIEKCQHLAAALEQRRSVEARSLMFHRASAALTPLIQLGELAEAQVSTLQERLKIQTALWRQRCYNNPFVTAGHPLRDTSMNAKGVLEIHVGYEGATAPAQHVSNASALRASLMAFYFAFWEYVLQERGGISMLLFDDPQELLDQDNKHRLARLLPELVKHGGQVLLTTHDRSFAREAVEAGRRYADAEHRSVHPANAARPTLELAPAIEELDRKRSLYQQDVNNASLAQDLAGELRTFLEARLADMFDDPSYPGYSAPTRAPTFSDYLDRLRRITKQSAAPLFKSKSVIDFCNCKPLQQGSNCLRVLNASHHQKSAISPGDVHQVLADFSLLRDLAEQMHTEFRLWRWRDSITPAPEHLAIAPWQSPIVPHFKTLIQPDLAAFTGVGSNLGSQDSAMDALESSWFSDKVLLYVKTSNLGFSIPSGSIAIAEKPSYDGRDHNLVVAKQKGHLLARRLFKPSNGGEVSLAAEAPDPRKSTPTLNFDPNDVVLHRIVGMLSEQLAPPSGKGEAIPITEASSLAQIACAYRVREESGIPLALPGQVVLGGESIGKTLLADFAGTLAAVSLSNGLSVFKRIGNPVPGTAQRLWQLESVGGLGDSIVISLVEPDDDTEEYREDPPRFVSARKIIGVLYSV